jgi:hypothetical protein
MNTTAASSIFTDYDDEDEDMGLDIMVWLRAK